MILSMHACHRCIRKGNTSKERRRKTKPLARHKPRTRPRLTKCCTACGEGPWNQLKSCKAAYTSGMPSTVGSSTMAAVASGRRRGPTGEEQGKVIPGRVLGHTSLAGRQDTLQNVASDDDRTAKWRCSRKSCQGRRRRPSPCA